MGEMIGIRQAAIVLAVVAVVGGAFAGVASAQSGVSDRIVVDASGNGDYTSIQAAVDNASTGTTIEIEPGEYSEAVTVGTSNLTIVGTPGEDRPGPGEDAPVMNGTGSDAPAVTLGAGVEDVRIEGLVMEDYRAGATFVNGVDAGDHEDVVIAHNRIEAHSGVGVVASDGTTLSDVRVTANVVDVTANGVLSKTVDDGSPAVIENLTIERNAFTGGVNGIYLVGSSAGDQRAVSITNNTFQNVDVGVELDTEMNASAVTVRANAFDETDSYGVQNRNTAANVDATHNDWGAPSGPYNPTTNPGGAGERVSANVEYDPWDTRYVELGSASGGSGQNVTVPVTVHSDDIAGYELEISYDPSVVRPVGISDGEFERPVSHIDESHGLINITAAQATSASAPTVAQITFEVVGEVNDTATIEVDSGESAVFGTNGTELDAAYGQSTVSVDLLGDVDDDGRVTAGDAVLLQRHLVGESVAIDESAADVDADGDVDAGDVLALQKRLVA
ncbi:cohesin domain-containing protein [Halococcoides cellulosivorans]|uniref:Dockerin domain-containing protein n=1 Tax=Halococcoides cellulosivorans TaxID=1679096 RepID=A0A2R4X304_9EURY|nr:cohesin domain-containing protein [Halococcoides cellulosivorans]AWB28180.1 hypothetical protein HARCEL1_10915 [Halococcoides cellulosivorans]